MRKIFEFALKTCQKNWNCSLTCDIAYRSHKVQSTNNTNNNVFLWAMNKRCLFNHILHRDHKKLTINVFTFENCNFLLGRIFLIQPESNKLTFRRRFLAFSSSLSLVSPVSTDVFNWWKCSMKVLWNKWIANHSLVFSTITPAEISRQIMLYELETNSNLCH